MGTELTSERRLFATLHNCGFVSTKGQARGGGSYQQGKSAKKEIEERQRPKKEEMKYSSMIGLSGCFHTLRYTLYATHELSSSTQ